MSVFQPAVRSLLIGLLCMFCLLPSPLWAQGADTAGEPVPRQEYQRVQAVAKRLLDENLQFRQQVEGVDAPIYKAYVEAKTAEYAFQVELMNESSSSFFHQRIASYVMLVLVVAVVMAGLFFAHVQLMAGLKGLANAAVATGTTGMTGTVAAPAAIPAAADAAGGPADPVTPVAAPADAGGGAPAIPDRQAAALLGTNSVTAELTKITVSSSVVGIVVLVISLVFLYIYILQVFPLKSFDPYQPALHAPSDTSAQTPAAASPASTPVAK